MISKTYSIILTAILIAPTVIVEAADAPNGRQEQPPTLNAVTEYDKNVSIVLNPDASIKLRVIAAHSLPLDLRTPDVNALLRFLTVCDDAREKNIDGLRFLKNEVMTALRTRDQSVTDTAKILIQISDDERQDIVIRDYAVQHLCTIYETQSDATLREGILASIRKHVLNSNAVAASALLALHHICESDPSVSTELLCKRSVHLAGSPNCCVSVPAIAICAERKLNDVLPLIRKLAAKENDPSRVSAIAALGYLGNREDIVFLRQLEVHKDSCLNDATTVAVARLARRLDKNGLAQAQP